MTDHPERSPFYTKRVYRLLSGIFGLGLVCIGVYIMFFTGPITVQPLIAGAVIVLFGANMALSAYRAKESWLSKLGPWP